jgi:hypothetical protein
MRHNGPSVEKSVRVAAQTRINVRVKFLRSENRHRRRQRGDISKPINFGHVNAVRNPLREVLNARNAALRVKGETPARNNPIMDEIK